MSVRDVAMLGGLRATRAGERWEASPRYARIDT